MYYIIHIPGKKKKKLLVWRSRHWIGCSTRAFMLVSIQRKRAQWATPIQRVSSLLLWRGTLILPSRSPIFAVLLVTVEGPRHSKFIVRWGPPSCPLNLADRRGAPREFVAGSKLGVGGYRSHPNVTKYRMHYAWARRPGSRAKCAVARDYVGRLACNLI